MQSGPSGRFAVKKGSITMEGIKGKIVLVTGANKGIGKAIAK